MQSTRTPLEPNPPEPVPVKQKSKLGRRIHRAFGPIAAGLVIDFVDLATFGPFGLLLGLPLGGLCGYWMGTALGLERKQALWCALAAGIYCMIPLTEFLPLATLVGAFARFHENKDEDEPAPAPAERSRLPVEGEDATERTVPVSRELDPPRQG